MGNPVSDPLVVRIRIYVAGLVADETTMPLGVGTRDLIGDLATQHAVIARQADQAGKRWLIEFRFPDGDHVRWGNDPDGMVEPIEVVNDRLLDAIMRYHQ
jgi:hypothetical protein